jgi:hypothetical protein
MLYTAAFVDTCESIVSTSVAWITVSFFGAGDGLGALDAVVVGAVPHETNSSTVSAQAATRRTPAVDRAIIATPHTASDAAESYDPAIRSSHTNDGCAIV